MPIKVFRAFHPEHLEDLYNNWEQVTLAKMNKLRVVLPGGQIGSPPFVVSQPQFSICSIKANRGEDTIADFTNEYCLMVFHNYDKEGEMEVTAKSRFDA